MKFLQTYYTSCEVGQTGFSGFQFYSYSEGITEDELQEITRLGAYETPFGMPTNPTQDEVLNVLPVAFKYFRLESGRVGVVQTTACTMEYTGRPGNFFAHALILEKGEFPILPILFQNNDLLLHDLTQEQKAVQTLPPTLPVLSVNVEDVLSAATQIRPDREFVKHYLQPKDNREIVGKLLDTLLSENGLSQKMIVANTQVGDIVYVLSKALPYDTVMSLTFSTYSRQPENEPVLLSGTTCQGSGFDFDNDWTLNSYQVFHAEKGLSSRLGDNGELSGTIINLLVSAPNQLNDFYRFSYNFEVRKNTANLNLIANIFNKQSFSHKWQEILGFIVQYAKEEYVDAFLEEYHFLIDQLSLSIKSASEYLELLELLEKLIKRSSVPTKSLKWFFTMYTQAIDLAMQEPCNVLVSFNTKMVNLVVNEHRQAFQQFFFNEYLSHLEVDLGKHPALKVLTWVVSTSRILVGSLKNVTNFFTVTPVRKLLVASCKQLEDQPTDLILCFMHEAEEDLGLVMVQISVYSSEKAALHLIAAFYNSKPSPERVEQLETHLRSADNRDLYFSSLPYYYEYNKSNKQFLEKIFNNEPNSSDFEQLSLFFEEFFLSTNSINSDMALVSLLLRHPKIGINAKQAIITYLDNTVFGANMEPTMLKEVVLFDSIIPPLVDITPFKCLELIFATEKASKIEDIQLVIDKLKSFPNGDKLKVNRYFDYYYERLTRFLRKEENWKSYFSLNTHIPDEQLLEKALTPLKNTGDISLLLSFVGFVHVNKNEKYEELLKKALVSIDKKKYNQLKEEIGKASPSLQEYFGQLDKQVKIKRIFNFKF